MHTKNEQNALDIKNQGPVHSMFLNKYNILSKFGYLTTGLKQADERTACSSVNCKET